MFPGLIFPWECPDVILALQIVEKAYQQTKNFDKLSFLYLAIGSTEKLSKMQNIANARGDPMSRFHNALYAGDVGGRIEVLRDVGMCKSKSCSLYLIPQIIMLLVRPFGVPHCKN
jgi:hypothetical protein